MNKRFYLVTTFILLYSFCIAQQSQWTKVSESSGITVYTRPVKGSDLNEFKGITIINARLEVVGEVLRDIDNYTAWVADIKESSIIKKYNSDKMIIRLLQTAPWPVNNREMILTINSTNNYNKGIADIRFYAIELNDRPINKGTVRITDMDGSYYLEYISREKTRVTYTVRSNPGGALPSSIANMASRELPLRTLKGMATMVKQTKYIQLGNQSIDKNKIEEAIKNGQLLP